MTYSSAQKNAFAKISSGETGCGVDIRDVMKQMREGEAAHLRHQVSVGRVAPDQADRISRAGQKEP